MIAYRYADFRVTSSAIGGGGCLHLRGVLSIGAHHIAMASIVGIVIPVEPAIKGTGSRGRR